MASPRALGADLLLRIGVDASGVDAEVASKLTAVERAAVASGDRIATGVSRGANKATAAQLRVVAATERYNSTLKRTGATQGQIASAQASLITAQRTATREAERAASANVTLAKSERSRAGAIKDSLRTAGLAVAAYKVGQVIRDSIDLSKDYQDAVDRNASALGQGAANITRFANTTAGAYNLSNLAAEKFVGDFALLFEKSGSTVEKATEQSIELTKRLADVRSFYGGTLDDAKTAFQSALVGENEPIRRYGVLLDEARLKQIAFSQGLTKDATSTLPPAVKAQAAYVAILQQTTKAQGDVARTGDSAANSAEDAREKFERAKVELGEGLLPVYTSLARTAADVAPALAVAGKAIGAIFGNDVTRRAVLGASAVAGGLLVANKAVKLYGEVSANVFRRNAEKVASNIAVARSYDAVGTAASRAAIAEGTASATPGKSARGGLSSLAVGPVGAVVATTAGALMWGGDKTKQSRAADRAADVKALSESPRKIAALRAEMGKAREELAQIEKRRTNTTAKDAPALFVQMTRRRSELEGRILQIKADLNDARSINGNTNAVKKNAAAQKAATDATAAHAEQIRLRNEALRQAEDLFGRDPFAKSGRGENIDSARRTLEDAKKARDEATRALSDARGGGGKGASGADIEIAELRLQAARQRLAKGTSTPGEKAGVLAAQQRLNDLRGKGKATAEQTEDAERRIADAIDSQKDAQRRVNEARAALDEARGISAPEALKRLRGNIAEQGQLGTDIRTLIGKGASKEALAELQGLEREAPGTIHRIATTNGKRYVREFSAGIAELSRKTSAIAVLYEGTEKEATLRGRRDAKAYHRAYITAILEEGLVPAGAAPADTPSRANSTRALPNKVRNAGWDAP